LLIKVVLVRRFFGKVYTIFGIFNKNKKKEEQVVRDSSLLTALSSLTIGGKNA